MDPVTLASVTAALTALASKVSEGVASKAGEDLWKEAKKLFHWETQEPKLSDLQAAIQSQLSINEDLAQEIISLLKCAPAQVIDQSQFVLAGTYIVHNYSVVPQPSPASALPNPPLSQTEPIAPAGQEGHNGAWGLSKPQIVKTAALLALLMACVYPLPLLAFKQVSAELPKDVLDQEEHLFIQNQTLLLVFDLAILGGLAFAAGKWRSAGNAPGATSKIRAFSLWFVATYALIVRQLQLDGELTAKTLNNTAPSMAWPLWLGGICLLISAATLVFSLLGAPREHIQ